MKLKYPIIFIIIVIGLLWIYSLRGTRVRYHHIDNTSWRERVKYTTVNKLTEKKRKEIFNQWVAQMTINDNPDSSYKIVALENDLDVDELKNIIGEGISENWSITDSILTKNLE